MRYRRNSYGSGGGYDTTGRWRSEAWHMDGGANDEGWHYRYCGSCGKETEHGRGSGCVPCGDRSVLQNARAAKSKSRSKIFSLYEEKTGSLPSFLASLKHQNTFKKLSQKQLSVGRKLLSNQIESAILDKLWD